MANHAALLSVLAMTAMQDDAIAAQKPLILACNIPAQTIARVPVTGDGRLFRIAPGSLQAWDPDKKAFGQNLCSAYSCVRAADRTEGTISSASVAYTIGVKGGQGYWRVMGASGGGPRSGACRVVTGPPK